MAKDKPIRVLTCYYRPKPGGFCIRYFRTINALLNQGCEVHYLAVVRFPINHSKCIFHRFPWPRGKTDSLLFWVLFQLFAPFILTYLGFRWRITHCFAFGTTYGCMLQPLKWFRQLPLTLFLRADTVENHRIKGHSQWLIFLETLIEGIALNGVRLYGVSDTLTQTVVARHQHAKPCLTATLRNDVPPVKHPKGAEQLSRSIRLASVGVLEARKNQAFLFECLAELRAEDIILNIYGTGTDDKRLRSYSALLKLDRQIIFKGWVAAAEIWSNIDLLLMPSLHEGAPNAVLEALAHQIPVLASDIPEHNEILPAQNLLRLNDLETWCGRLTQIVCNPELELNRLRASQNIGIESLMFDWNKRVCDSILTGT